MAARANEWLAWQQEENLQPLVLLGQLVYLPQGVVRMALVIFVGEMALYVLFCST